MTNLLTFHGLRTMKLEVSAAQAAISRRHEQARHHIDQAEHQMIEALKVLQTVGRQADVRR